MFYCDLSAAFSNEKLHWVPATASVSLILFTRILTFPMMIKRRTFPLLASCFAPNLNLFNIFRFIFLELASGLQRLKRLCEQLSNVNKFSIMADRHITRNFKASQKFLNICLKEYIPTHLQKTSGKIRYNHSYCNKDFALKYLRWENSYILINQ